MKGSSSIELKSNLAIGLAYLIAAIAGACALGAQILIMTSLETPRSSLLNNPFSIFISAAIFGVILCLCVEVILVTPLIIGFRRFKWGWVNPFTGITIGFLLGAVPAFLVFLIPFEGELDVAMGYFAHGFPTWAGWMRAASDGLIFGFVGAVSAAVFWAIAIRSSAGQATARK